MGFPLVISLVTLTHFLKVKHKMPYNYTLDTQEMAFGVQVGDDHLLDDVEMTFLVIFLLPVSYRAFGTIFCFGSIPRTKPKKAVGSHFVKSDFWRIAPSTECSLRLPPNFVGFFRIWIGGSLAILAMIRKQDGCWWPFCHAELEQAMSYHAYGGQMCERFEYCKAQISRYYDHLD